MTGMGNIVQKAFYLGVGLAAAASERAGGTLAELRVQAQKLADELVAKGELTTEEARKLVDDILQQGQQQAAQPANQKTQADKPRLIEILSEDEEPAASEDQDVDALRQQVEAMQAELRRLKRQ
ncbi:phasin family protein [Lyngbya aestuarii]|uniref:phasin family protein n=1 Tax=Lyngbya aestuarii TaxID=118322 RepID=UPI00403D9BFC